MLNNWVDIQASRGEDVSDVLAQMTKLEQGSTSNLARLYRLDALACDAMARGDFKGASAAYQETVEIDYANGNENLARAARTSCGRETSPRRAGCRRGSRRPAASAQWPTRVDRRWRPEFWPPKGEPRRRCRSTAKPSRTGETRTPAGTKHLPVSTWRCARSDEPEVAEVIASTRAILERLRREALHRDARSGRGQGREVRRP